MQSGEVDSTGYDYDALGHYNASGAQVTAAQTGYIDEAFEYTLPLVRSSHGLAEQHEPLVRPVDRPLAERRPDWV